MKGITFAALFSFAFQASATINVQNEQLSQGDLDMLAEARQAAEYGNKIIAEALSGAEDPSLTNQDHQAIQDARESVEKTHQRYGG